MKSYNYVEIKMQPLQKQGICLAPWPTLTEPTAGVHSSQEDIPWKVCTHATKTTHDKSELKLRRQPMINMHSSYEDNPWQVCTQATKWTREKKISAQATKTAHDKSGFNPMKQLVKKSALKPRRQLQTSVDSSHEDNQR